MEENTIVELFLHKGGLPKGVDEVKVVDSPKDYIEARKKIRYRSLREGCESVKIHIQEERYWQWFRDLREIGSPEITTHHEDARRQLEKRWNSTIPANLSSQEIQKLGLLEISAPPTGADPSDYILENVLNSVWLEEPSLSHAIKLTLHAASSGLSRDDSEKGFYVNLDWLRQKQKEKAKKWANTSQDRLRPFYRFFTNHPVDATKLACTSVFALSSNRAEIRNTDEKHGNVVWKEFASGLPSSPHDLDDWLGVAQQFLGEEIEPCRKLEDIGRELLHRQLLAYWNTTLRNQKSDEEDLKTVLGLLPGNSLAELEALKRYVDNSGQVFTASNYEREIIEEKYGAFSDGFKSVRSFLQRYTIPTLPPDPEKEWMDKSNLEPWKEWLEQKYIPFKASIDNFEGNLEEETVKKLEKKANKFSDWFVENYESLTHKGDDLITDVLGEVTELVDKGKTVVWVIWDNLPATHSEKVLQSAGNNGLHPSRGREWRLSVLPSVTKVCLPALLSGSPNLGDNLSSMSRSDLVSEFTSKNISVSYSKSLRELEEKTNEEKDIHIIHYKDYDRKLHKKDYELEERRSLELKRSRKRIFEHVERLITNISSDSSISVVISSDHGSSLLPNHSEQVQLPDESNPNHLSSRAAALPKASADLETIFDPEITTVLDPDKCVLNEHYVMARGFRSFDSLRIDDGYRHGGALPEEVLTPLLVFIPDRPEYRPLKLNVVESNLRRGEKRSVCIKITNYNKERVSPVHIRLKKEGETVVNKVVEEIDKNTSEIVEANIKVHKHDHIRDGLIRIEARLTARYLGQTELQTESIEAPASERAVDSQTGEGLDSFFDQP